jgi:hypothetical protein
MKDSNYSNKIRGMIALLTMVFLCSKVFSEIQVTSEPKSELKSIKILKNINLQEIENWQSLKTNSMTMLRPSYQSLNLRTIT